MARAGQVNLGNFPGSDHSGGGMGKSERGIDNDRGTPGMKAKRHIQLWLRQVKVYLVFFLLTLLRVLMEAKVSLIANLGLNYIVMVKIYFQVMNIKYIILKNTFFW